MNYSNFVSKILKNDILESAAQDIANSESDPNTPSINLVSKKWNTILESNEKFLHCQFISSGKFSTDTYYEYETARETIFNVTLVANCRFVAKSEERAQRSLLKHKNAIIIYDSEPLLKIAKAMTNDVESFIPISDNHKFQFKSCNILTCDLCAQGFKYFTENGYTVQGTQPCIAITKVFDGKNIVNRFYSQIEESFKTDFFTAIVQLKINLRYMFLDKNNGNQRTYRIGGNVTNMIAFNEAKLDLVPKINLGAITAIETPDEAAESSNSDSKKEVKIMKEEQINIFNESQIDDIDVINESQIDEIDETGNFKRSIEFDISVKKSKRPRVKENIFSID